jgi:hypothetical protein
MTSKERRIYEYLGIPEWDKAGYTGKGIKIMSIEPISSKKKFPNVIPVNGYSTEDLKGRNHADKVMSQMIEIAPDAEYYTCSKKGSAEDSWKPLYLDFILKNKIDLFTSSKLNTAYEVSSTNEKYMQECIDNGTTFFIAAGNKEATTSKNIYPEAKSDKYIAIGAASLSTDMPGKEFYSCEGEELDYMMIVGWDGENGTSFATNRFAALCARVQQFFLEKAGRTLHRNELINFINDNVMDMATQGFDTKTGYGLFILPKPSTIDVDKYVPEYGKENIYCGGFPEVRSDAIMRGTDKLHPELQKIVQMFLNECKNRGLDVLITETLRTQEEQEALYAKGRTEPGKIVTNCRGYQSPHCWGVSFDFCRNKKGWEYDNIDGFFDKVGQVIKDITSGELDLYWGGDFKTFVDKPHAEMVKYMPNQSTDWLVQTYGTPEKFKETWREGGDDKMFEELIKKYGEDKVKAAVEELIKGIVDNEDIATWSKEAFEKMTKKDEKGNSILAGVGNGEYDWKKPLTLERFAVLMLKMGILK